MFRLIKRMLDICFAIVLLIITFPLFFIAIIGIKLSSRGPIFILQRRVGKGNKDFYIIKVRTMITEKEKEGRKLTDSERILAIGKYLRRYSIDELPQLLNIIKGDMSFIGPRPLPFVYLPFYTEKELHRHDVKPGLSGYAQISGRNFLDWGKRFELDLHYVNNLSFKLDAKIFFVTMKKIIFKQEVGIYGKDSLVKSLHEIREKKE